MFGSSLIKTLLCFDGSPCWKDVLAMLGSEFLSEDIIKAGVGAGEGV